VSRKGALEELMAWLRGTITADGPLSLKDMFEVGDAIMMFPCT
jgi:hypothetical protein